MVTRDIILGVIGEEKGGVYCVVICLLSRLTSLPTTYTSISMNTSSRRFFPEKLYLVSPVWEMLLLGSCNVHPHTKCCCTEESWNQENLTDFKSNPQSYLTMVSGRTQLQGTEKLTQSWDKQSGHWYFTKQMFRDAGQALETSSCFSTLASSVPAFSSGSHEMAWYRAEEERQPFPHEKKFSHKAPGIHSSLVGHSQVTCPELSKGTAFPSDQSPSGWWWVSFPVSQKTSLNKTGALLEAEEKDWATRSIYSKCILPFTTNICDGLSSVSLELTRECTDFWPNITLGVAERVFLGELVDWVKQMALPRAGELIHSQLKAWVEWKGRVKVSSSSLAAWAETWVSFLRTQTEMPSLFESPACWLWLELILSLGSPVCWLQIWRLLSPPFLIINLLYTHTH